MSNGVQLAHVHGYERVDDQDVDSGSLKQEKMDEDLEPLEPLKRYRNRPWTKICLGLISATALFIVAYCIKLQISNPRMAPWLAAQKNGVSTICIMRRLVKWLFF